MKNTLLYLLFLLFLNKPSNEPDSLATRTSNDLVYKAEQIHLSFALEPSSIQVTWSTLKEVEKSVLEYRIYHSNNKTYGPLIRNFDVQMIKWQSGYEDDALSIPYDTYSSFQVELREKNYQDHFTYRASMDNLEPNCWYVYRIISYPRQNVSFASIKGDTKSFLSPRDYQTNSNQTIQIAMFGDLGLDNGQSIGRLTELVNLNAFDFIIHNGDFAYDLDRNQGKHGDAFMRLIEPIASRVPYQTSVGNHEAKEHFSHYDNRFTMYNSASLFGNKQNNFFYTFNAGPVHFIAISTEYYYFIDYMGEGYVRDQYEFLKSHLSSVNQLAERQLRPWIIVYGHRPMYCSSSDHDDCTKQKDIVRVGLPKSGKYGLEELFYNYGVDVLFWSHEHQYERFLPIFNNSVYNGTDSPNTPYHNPRAPVHIISGSAGCEERIDDFKSKVAIGSVVRISDYGFTKMTATKKQLLFEQISDDKEGSVVDNFMISKTRQNFP